ncbi:MAG: hypothetical protein QF927_08200 [Verrucomicrobiota bacterium]|jgi:hypothetical protein|nr:hypothetical protein [Verrucomicrobiota bacterium]
MVALLVLLAWLPASSHCLLAVALQSAVVNGCCIESKQAQSAGPHHNTDCCPFCDTFESGKFLAASKDKQDFSAGAAELVPLTAAIQSVQQRSSAPSFIPRESPSEAATWQFETRSACMGRSPNVSY